MMIFFKKIVNGRNVKAAYGVASLLGCSDTCPDYNAAGVGGCCNGYGFDRFYIIWH